MYISIIDRLSYLHIYKHNPNGPELLVLDSDLAGLWTCMCNMCVYFCEHIGISGCVCKYVQYSGVSVRRNRSVAGLSTYLA